MKKIKQKDRTGCGIACVAMIVNKPYSQIKKKMRSLGCFNKNTFYTEYYDLKKTLKSYKVRTSKIYKKKSWKSMKKDAIVAINYNKKRDTWHWVVFDKKNNHVLDPNSKKPYRNITDKRMKIKSYINFN